MRLHSKLSAEIKAMIIILFILIVSILLWIKSSSLANTLLAAITAAATAAMAIMIKELDLTLKHLRYQSLQSVYQYFDNSKFKSFIDNLDKQLKNIENEKISNNLYILLINCINNINEKNISKICKCIENKIWKYIRYYTITLNKVGYLLYKDFIDDQYLAEEFGGLIVRAYSRLRPLLVAARNCAEPSEKPWYMRRFAIFLYKVMENRLSKGEFREHFRKWLTVDSTPITYYYALIYNKCEVNPEYCKHFCPACHNGAIVKNPETMLDLIIEGKCSLAPDSWFESNLRKSLRKYGVRLKPMNFPEECSLPNNN